MKRKTEIKKMDEKKVVDSNLHPKIKDSEIEKLKSFIGKEVSVETIDANYQFSENIFSGEREHCGSLAITSAFYQSLDKVEKNEIKARDDRIPFVGREIRYPGSYFLPGKDGETYCLKIISEIKSGGKTIFQRNLEDYMPEDIKEKLKTYKSVSLPPSMD